MYKENLNQTVSKFNAWWKGENTGRPLMWVIGKEDKPKFSIIDVIDPVSPEDKYLNVENAIKRYRNYCAYHSFLGESYQSLSFDLGPGSMALYLGSNPKFQWDTIWFEECMNSIEDYKKVIFDENNFWWEKHTQIITKANELANGDFIINIPDIIENIDILSAMRGGENLIFDIIDEPEIVLKSLKIIDEIYFKYYDVFYEIVKTKENISGFTAFCILGEGKTAKVQCDFSAMISPDCFREFVVPSLIYQCNNLDNAFYHLDGISALIHVDALMEIKNLKALQFTAGPGHPDGASEKWYELYDKVRAAGKSLWVNISDGSLQDWISSADRIVKRYGTSALYLLFPDMDINSAIYLMDYAEKHWK